MKKEEKKEKKDGENTHLSCILNVASYSPDKQQNVDP